MGDLSLGDFVRMALESSVYVDPRAPGLTLDEIIEVGARVNKERGEIVDQLKTLHLTDREGRLWSENSPLRPEFDFLDTPEYRNPEAFEFVFDYLRGRRRKLGRDDAWAERDEVIGAGVAAGRNRTDLEVAFAAYSLAGWFEVKGTAVRFEEQRENWVSPKTQVAQMEDHQRRTRMHFEEIFMAVKAVTAKRMAIIGGTEATDRKTTTVTTAKRSIDEDASDLMRYLADAEDHRPRGKGGMFNYASVATNIGWPARRINLASDYLNQRGFLRVARGAGTTPYDYSGIELTTPGLALAQRVRAQTTAQQNQPKEEHMATDAPDRKTVFVIHGRNIMAAQEMGKYLKSLGLIPLFFEDVRKTIGSPTVIEVVEKGMRQAQGVIALFTPDEYSAVRPDLRGKTEVGPDVERWQARPNVILEAGLAYGRDRNRVVTVSIGDVSLSSDMAGIHVLRMTNDFGKGSAREQLRSTLKHALKCDVDLEPNEWHTEGDFDGAKLAEVSARDPFRDP